MFSAKVIVVQVLAERRLVPHIREERLTFVDGGGYPHGDIFEAGGVPVCGLDRRRVRRRVVETRGVRRVG